MKKLFPLMLIFASVCTMSSCDKDDDDDTNTPTYYRVATTSYSYNGQTEPTTNYTYDSEGRCIHIDNNNGNYTTLTYGSGQVTYTDYENGVAGQAVVFQLNAAGNVTSGGNSTYTYNSDGRMISQVYVENGVTQTYVSEYTNGNMTRIGLEGATVDYTTFTYLTDKLESRMVGSQTLLGLPSKNLVNTTEQHSAAGSYITTNTYTYDSKNRVITDTRDLGSGNSEMITYTYTD